MEKIIRKSYSEKTFCSFFYFISKKFGDMAESFLCVYDMSEGFYTKLQTVSDFWEKIRKIWKSERNPE